MSAETKISNLIYSEPTDNELFKFLNDNPDVVRFVIDNKRDDYYFWIGKYPGLSADDLNTLEKINHKNLKFGLLENPNVSGAWLESKIKFINKNIKTDAYTIPTLEHPNLPFKIFKKLFTMEEKFAIPHLLKNPSCPSEFITKTFDMIKTMTFDDMLKNVKSMCYNPNLPDDIFEKIMTIQTQEVRIFAEIILANKTFDKQSIKILDNVLGRKTSFNPYSWYETALAKIATNKEIRTNRLLQSFLCDKLYKNIVNTNKEHIFAKVLPYIELDNIMKILSKFHISSLTALLFNPATPLLKAEEILMHEKNIMFRNLKPIFNFTPNQLINITIKLNKTNRNIFFEIYQEKFDAETLRILYMETQDEIFIPRELKSIFLF